MGLQSFRKSIRETELAELKFKERNMEFEQKKHTDTIVERQRELIFDKEEEEVRGKLKLEKLKPMMKTMISDMKELLEAKTRDYPIC